MVRHRFASSGGSMEAHDVEGHGQVLSAPGFARYGDQMVPTCNSSSRASLLGPRSAKGVLGYSSETPWKGAGGTD